MTMNRRSRAWEVAVAAAVLVASLNWVAAAGAAPIRLELAGEPAPENLSVSTIDGERYVPASALLLLGWSVRSTNDEHSSVAVSDGKSTFQFDAGSDEVKEAGGGARPLQQAPVQKEGRLLLPSSAVADVLGVAVEWDEPLRVLRLGTPPTPEAAKVQQWCAILGISDAQVFHRASFRVQLALPQGAQLPEDQEFLLAGRANADACLQVFERYEDNPPRPLLGQSDEGQELLYPLAQGKPPHWTAMTARDVRRWPLSPPPAGKVIYLAVATTASDPPADLLKALGEGDAPEGSWAIDAIEVSVSEPVAEETGAPAE